MSVCAHVCTHVCAHMFVHMCVRLFECLCVCVRVYMCACMCSVLYLYISMCVHECVFQCVQFKPACLFVHVHMWCVLSVYLHVCGTGMVGKKSALPVWKEIPQHTQTLVDLSTAPTYIEEESMQTIETRITSSRSMTVPDLHQLSTRLTGNCSQRKPIFS